MLPPTTNENKHRGPQPDIRQRVRELGTLSPKWAAPSPSHQSSGNPSKEEAQGREDTKKQGPLKQHDQSSYELTETEAACAGHA